MVDATAPLTDPTRALGRTRARVLGVLRDAEAPQSADQVAAATGLHVSTARFHLDHLVADELASRQVERRATPGRRRVLYAASATGVRSYRLLSEVLSGVVGSLVRTGGEPDLRQAGTEWGGRLVERATPSPYPSDGDDIRRLTSMLAEIGFAPRVDEEVDLLTVALRQCPFREVAAAHPDVVCELHHGLIDGALSRLGSTWRATSLHPWVGPSRCVATLQRLADDDRQ
ncbi:hypothetical protein Q6346_07520 [Isoptericola sp. b490]|uniref:helix-turn-helix transcriptional regulator n=1 Tax=Actinotalea lenta TaxID=3064654 RepID=UPI0027125C1A|nr:helix-turn-helix domain-containing protein [Isoptericola sp. b490]MDO8121160.1 hypothetical protein [Isoptericola sp. b490]